MINVVMSGKWCTVSGHLDERVYDFGRNILGFKKWKTDTRTLVFDPNHQNMKLLRKLIPEANYCQESKELLSRIDRVELEARENQNNKERPIESDFFNYKTKPYNHQALAFNISKEKEYFAYLMEMGTGKSKVFIDNTAYLWQNSHIDTAIIIAPNGVHRQWLDEQIPTHIPDWCPYDGLVFKSGMQKTKKGKAEVERILAIKDHSVLKVFCINIEALSHKSGLDFTMNLILNSESCIIGLDESSRIKNPTSNRTKSIIKLGELAKYRRIMSGSPVTKGLEDLYSQLYFLSPDIIGLNTFTSFKRRYCEEVEHTNNATGMPFRKIVGYRNEEELKNKLISWSFQVRKEECLDLPPIVYEKRYVEMHDEQAKLYKRLKDVYLTEIESTTEEGTSIIDATLAVTRLMYLQRILCGHIKDDDEIVHRIPKEDAIPRVQTCMSIIDEAIDESDGKIIIWCRFINDVSNISEALDKKKIKHVVYAGKDKDDNLQIFKNDPETRVMISNPKSGGIGLNITEANTMIYYSNSFEAEVRWQSEARTHRSGQTRKVTCIDLVTKDTVDEKITEALREKKNIAEIIVEDCRKFFA